MVLQQRDIGVTVPALLGLLPIAVTALSVTINMSFEQIMVSLAFDLLESKSGINFIKNKRSYLNGTLKNIKMFLLMLFTSTRSSMHLFCSLLLRFFD